MNFLDPSRAADLWLLIVCLALIVIGIISVIYASRQQPPKRYYLDRVDYAAQNKRTVSRNGYKSRMGAR
jgi:ABC-type Na+ efflux pump permease subunit